MIADMQKVLSAVSSAFGLGGLLLATWWPATGLLASDSGIVALFVVLAVSSVLIFWGFALKQPEEKVIEYCHRCQCYYNAMRTRQTCGMGLCRECADII